MPASISRSFLLRGGRGPRYPLKRRNKGSGRIREDVGTYLARVRGNTEIHDEKLNAWWETHTPTFPWIVQPVCERRYKRRVRRHIDVETEALTIHLGLLPRRSTDRDKWRRHGLESKEAHTGISSGSSLSFGLSLLWTTNTANLVRAASRSDSGRDCTSRSTSF